MRLLTAMAATAALTLAAAGPAGAQSTPKLPGSTAGAKSCKTTKRAGFTIRVYVTKGRLGCKRARTVMARKPIEQFPDYRYFDWTKGGNGPWSDVWVSKSGRTVIAGIIKA